ncbi:unnamed protein product [Vitrella brassicaformis CCMP3155]|uniref:GAR domain-containing protein n=1 Tax=Vitrella brassicaformis (strain CCMP3155) TaxID=1169540 RepID=A0A0G4EHK8_VITBC|nr:unnamed protein product [Vitrella brassicaformis CCMP3155]|eukprot:CEL95977.1 unnamed protein product [Vitrella brassicaformis CCMP3155]
MMSAPDHYEHPRELSSALLLSLPTFVAPPNAFRRYADQLQVELLDRVRLLDSIKVADLERGHFHVTLADTQGPLTLAITTDTHTLLTLSLWAGGTTLLGLSSPFGAAGAAMGHSRPFRFKLADHVKDGWLCVREGQHDVAVTDESLKADASAAAPGGDNDGFRIHMLMAVLPSSKLSKHRMRYCIEEFKNISIQARTSDLIKGLTQPIFDSLSPVRTGATGRTYSSLSINSFLPPSFPPSREASPTSRSETISMLSVPSVPEAPAAEEEEEEEEEEEKEETAVDASPYSHVVAVGGPRTEASPRTTHTKPSVDIDVARGMAEMPSPTTKGFIQRGKIETPIELPSYGKQYSRKVDHPKTDTRLAELYTPPRPAAEIPTAGISPPPSPPPKKGIGLSYAKTSKPKGPSLAAAKTAEISTTRTSRHKQPIDERRSTLPKMSKSNRMSGSSTRHGSSSRPPSPEAPPARGGEAISTAPGSQTRRSGERLHETAAPIAEVENPLVAYCISRTSRGRSSSALLSTDNKRMAARTADLPQSPSPLSSTDGKQMATTSQQLYDGSHGSGNVSLPKRQRDAYDEQKDGSCSMADRLEEAAFDEQEQLRRQLAQLQQQLTSVEHRAQKTENQCEALRYGLVRQAKHSALQHDNDRTQLTLLESQAGEVRLNAAMWQREAERLRGVERRQETLEQELSGLKREYVDVQKRLEESFEENARLREANSRLYEINDELCLMMQEMPRDRPQSRPPERTHHPKRARSRSPAASDGSPRARSVGPLPSHSSFIPVSSSTRGVTDRIDWLLHQHLNDHPHLMNCFRRLDEGVYSYCGKAVTARIANGQLVFRVGGGYLSFDSYITAHTPHPAYLCPFLRLHPQPRVTPRLKRIDHPVTPTCDPLDLDWVHERPPDQICMGTRWTESLRSRVVGVDESRQHLRVLRTHHQSVGNLRFGPPPLRETEKSDQHEEET